jgi:GNAT superfamily N-acetyltransferase
MPFSEPHEAGKSWRRYARKVVIGALAMELVPLEEGHRLQMERFQDELDPETVYLRHGAYVSAATRKSPAWLARQWNKEGQEGFSQGAFLNGRLIGIGSIYRLPGWRSAEAALAVAPEFQGLGRGGEKGVGGLLLDDLIRYARQEGLERITAHFAVRNPRCERLLRKSGLKISTWRPGQDASAVLSLGCSDELAATTQAGGRA